MKTNGGITTPNLLAYLAIETSSPLCSVALEIDNQLYIEQIETLREHNLKLLKMIKSLFQQAGCSIKDLRLIVFGEGPGSFVGTRLAVSVAQGLAYSHDLPVQGVSSLQAMAQTYYRQHRTPNILVGVDAKMQALYYGHYQAHEGLMQSVFPEEAIKPQDCHPRGPAVAIGDGWSAYPLQVPENVQIIDAPCYPQAQDLLTLARSNPAFKKASEAQPIYLRGNSLWKLKNH